MNADMSILLVEDMKIIADAMKTTLEDSGYRVVVAHSGTEAKAILAAVSDQGFTCLITDLGLGAGPDGWDVARDARAHDAEIFVIYMTGRDSDEWRAAGVPDSLIIQKPISAASLILAAAEMHDRSNRTFGTPNAGDVEGLNLRLSAAEHSNRLLTETAKALAVRQSVVTHNEVIALAKSRAETKTGQADLLASESALASSQKQTKLGLAGLLASAASLATLREQILTGQIDLRASEVAKDGLTAANGVLIANEAILEHIVEQRTAALTREMEERRIAEEALRQGEKLRAIGQLTGGIAHDFNNILQIVFSSTAFLRSPELADDRRTELLDSLDDAAELGSQVTSRLLAFARKKVLLPRSCDMNLLLDEMKELLLPTLGSKVALKEVLAVDLWPVIADQDQLRVAILNLAANARDAMLPDGGVFSLATHNVQLAATADRAAGDYVCLMISDTGSGMPAEVVQHAFEPFFTTKPRGRGTGLGLAQVWGFAKQSGGDVTIVTSDEGTSICLHFPRPSDAALDAFNVAETPEEQLPGRTVAALRKTILVVEDNENLSKLTASLLHQLGYDTLAAENAAEALSIIEGDDTVDGVFSDIVMPGDMNGVELAKTLRRRYPHLPVILATGYSEFLLEHPAPNSVEVMSKPYRVGELTAAIGRSFARVQAAA